MNPEPRTEGGDLLAARLARGGGRRTVPARSGATAPLTATQQGMWFESRLDPCDPRHHRPVVVRWRGSLDADALRRAVARLVARHPTLTTSYPLVGNHPRQLPPASFGAAPALDRHQVDLRPRDGRRDPAALAVAVVEAATRPIDLEHPGPVPVTVVSLADDDHAVVLALSHLALDGPSAEVLVRDLAVAYDAELAAEVVDLAGSGESTGPDAPACTFADWAAWRHESGPADEHEAELAWWSMVLAHRPPEVAARLARAVGSPDAPGVDPEVALGAGPGTVRRAHDGAEIGWVEVPAGVADGLRSLARVESATLHAAALAAFVAWAFEAADVDDLVVAVPVSDRDHPELDGVVGCFVRVVPLRLRVGPADTGRQLIRRASAVTQAVLDHRDVALPEITAAVASRGSTGVAAELADAHFQLDRRAPGPIRVGDGELALETVVHPERGPAVRVLDDGLRLLVSAVTPAGGPDDDRRLAAQVVARMADLVRHPDRPLGPASSAGARAAPATAEGERWETTPEPSEDGPTLVDLFVAAEAAHGARAAVDDGDQVLTYAELGARARGVAARLAELGVAAGDPVVVDLGRSVDWVVAVLGIVLAGAVYVPLDPSAPAERSAAMRADVEPAATVDGHGIHLEPRRDGADERVAGWSATGPAAPVYVLFTSGSTGRPKGVAVTHANVVALVQDPGYLPLTPDDVVVFSSSPIFDGATIEVWGAITSGACLAIVDEDDLVDPARLEAALVARRATVLGSTTALFHAVARHRPAAFASLRVVLFGGEAADPRWVRAVVDAGPPQRLIHDYGPTETTCVVAYHDVVGPPGPAGVVPIGRALERARLHVLDPRGRPLGVGLPGELHIGGDGVALGYVRRPDLTAERFVADPFTDRSDARLYRSGDLVVRRPDGELEFLGRVDTQIKIRGYRVELGEVEAALASHPDVDLAVVQARPGGADGVPWLAAYVVGRPGRTGGDLEAELVRHLADRLPAYMQPRRILLVEHLALTPTGKVDRHALPDPDADSDQGPEPADRHARPDRSDRSVSTGSTRPSGETGGHPGDGGDRALSAMVALWRSVLETDRVGPDDHFFDVGGHSLRAMALLAAVHDEFRVELRVADLARADTPRALTAVVHDEERVVGTDAVVELHPGPASADPVLFIPAGVAIHYLTSYRRLAQHLDVDRPAVTFEPPGMAPGTVPRATMGGLTRWYASLVEARQPAGSLRLIGHSLGALLALEVARAARRSGRHVAAVVMLDPLLPVGRPSTTARARTAASATVRRARAEWHRSGLGSGSSPAAWAARSGAGRAADLDRDLRAAAGQALRRYVPRPFDGPVTLVVAQGTPGEPVDDRGGAALIERWAPLLADPRIVEVRGTHVGPEAILADPYVAATAAAVRDVLR